jgi:diaminopropionate ammonia-lyase
MTDKCDFKFNEKKESGKKFVLEKYFTEEILDFHKSLPGYTPTPLGEIRLHLKNYGGKVFLKDESRRFSIGAFKSLGASWAIHNFLKNHKGEFTFCTATDGNHGRAVAWSSRIFGQKAKVFMPFSTVESRKVFIEDEGADVTILDGDYDFAVKMAQKESMKENHILIQDTAWEGYEYYPNLISAGYTTMIKELESQVSGFNDDWVNAIILQSGVGSWAASIILYLREICNFRNTKIIILEPLESDCLLESAKQGKISTTRKSQNTIMAGLNCGTPSISAWEIIHDFADVFVSIDDFWAEKAIRILANNNYRTCESGAAGLAGVLALYESELLKPVRRKLALNESSKFLVFNTEGITDPRMFQKITGRDYPVAD